MEQILHLYGLPYNALYPLICFDQRPCFLIAEVVAGLEMKAGQAARQHYAYEKKGSCNVLMRIEPLTGKRLAQIHQQRTRHEYAVFMKELAAPYPEAKKIRLIQDNLNPPVMRERFMRHLVPKKPLSCRSALSFITRLSQPVG